MNNFLTIYVKSMTFRDDSSRFLLEIVRFVRSVFGCIPQKQQKLYVSFGAGDGRKGKILYGVSDLLCKSDNVYTYISMDSRLPDHAVLAYLPPSSFELGLDKRHHLSIRFQAGLQRRQDQLQGDKGYIDGRKVKRTIEPIRLLKLRESNCFLG